MDMSLLEKITHSLKSLDKEQPYQEVVAFNNNTFKDQTFYVQNGKTYSQDQVQKTEVLSDDEIADMGARALAYAAVGVVGGTVVAIGGSLTGSMDAIGTISPDMVAAGTGILTAGAVMVGTISIDIIANVAKNSASRILEGLSELKNSVTNSVSGVSRKDFEGARLYESVHFSQDGCKTRLTNDEVKDFLASGGQSNVPGPCMR